MSPRRWRRRSAAIVIDAKTGKVLYSANANGRRYPASLTKMMTLYLTFEALANGQDQQEHARCRFRRMPRPQPPTEARRARPAVRSRSRPRSCRWSPSRPTIRPTALGEMLGGNEDHFARMMTAKARAARHERHGLPQCQRPARSRPVHHRARHGHARHRAAGSISRNITAISRSAPSSMARQRINGHNRLLGTHQGRRRHQDRLYTGLRLQSRLLGCRRRPPPRRRGAWAAPRAAAATTRWRR